MINLLEQFSRDLDYVQSLVYRGYNIRFKWNAQGQFVYTTDWPQFDNSAEINFGSNNWNFKDDMRKVIDRKLDILWRPKQPSIFSGAKWILKNNGGSTDLFLYLNKRIISVYPLLDSSDMPKLPELEKLAFQQLPKFLDC